MCSPAVPGWCIAYCTVLTDPRDIIISYLRYIYIYIISYLFPFEMLIEEDVGRAGAGKREGEKERKKASRRV